MQRNRKLDIAERTRLFGETGVLISHQQRGWGQWVQISKLHGHARHGRSEPKAALAERRKRSFGRLVLEDIKPLVGSLRDFFGDAKSFARGNDVDLADAHRLAASQHRAAIMGIVQIFEYHHDSAKPRRGSLIKPGRSTLIEQGPEQLDDRLGRGQSQCRIFVVTTGRLPLGAVITRWQDAGQVGLRAGHDALQDEIFEVGKLTEGAESAVDDRVGQGTEAIEAEVFTAEARHRAAADHRTPYECTVEVTAAPGPR